MNDVEKIEISMNEAKNKIELDAALTRLQNNKDFQTLFTDGYFKDYVLRLIDFKASISMQGDRDQSYLGSQIMAVGHVKNYLGYIQTEARLAKESIAVHEAERDLALMEEADNA